MIEKKRSWEMFNDISQKYEIINDILSFGIHHIWRKELKKNIPKKNNLTILDCATGTGSIVFSIMNSLEHHISHIKGTDLAEKMMAVAKKTNTKKSYSKKVSFEVADAMNLPYNENTYDVLTMAFGIRNVPNHKQALKEIYKVLKPHGRCLILEFSLPKNPIIKWVHLVYLRHILPFIGGLLSGNFSAYKYLNKTIETFPYGHQFLEDMKQVGFKNNTFKPLTFGSVTLYIGEK